MRFRSNGLKQRESAQKYRYRQQSGELVRRRWESHGGICEGCFQPAAVIEVAHLVSKGGHIIADRWASTPELCAALCCAATWGDRIGCHEEIDRGLNPKKLSELREQAFFRLAGKTGVGFGERDHYPAASLDAIRELIRQLEARAEDNA